MSTEAVSHSASLSTFEQVRLAREIIQTEGQAVLSLSDRLGDEFCQAADLLYHCRGNVIVIGMGKAGLIGQKIMATLASTGTRSHFVHPGEAFHGDLGRVHQDDVVLLFSFSGESEEVTRILPSLSEVPIIAVTGRPQSTMARAARVILDLGPLREACTMGLAPSTSTTAMLAMGDALALVVSRMRSFGPQDFVRYHPGGSLGRKLAKVDDVMRTLDQCRVAQDTKTVREVFVLVSRPGRRTGAIMLIDQQRKLTGLFTDSDLARLLEGRRDAYIDGPISDVMTRSPKSVVCGSMMTDAVEVLVEKRISELPVIDADGRPAGLIDVTDVVAWLPAGTPSAEPDDAPKPEDSAGPQTVPFAG